MRQITVESDLGKQLASAAGQVVLCDSEGRALGFFSPLKEPTPLSDLQLEPPHSLEEIEKMRQNRTGKPLSEILNRLGL